MLMTYTYTVAPGISRTDYIKLYLLLLVSPVALLTQPRSLTQRKGNSFPWLCNSVRWEVSAPNSLFIEKEICQCQIKQNGLLDMRGVSEFRLKGVAFQHCMSTCMRHSVCVYVWVLIHTVFKSIYEYICYMHGVCMN